jgi:GxxExxY protein
VIAASINVHRALGPGLLESIYELALMQEFADVGITAKRQVEVPVFYRGVNLGAGFRADFIVEEQLILEIKAVEAVVPVHLSQLITYLKLANIKRGLLLNFNVRLLKDGIKRVSI